MLFVCAVVFGLLIEFVFVLSPELSSTHYTYGRFLLDVTWRGRHVPLWVGLGWGCIVYSADWTTHRFNLPWYLIGFGMLATSVSTEQQGYRHWRDVASVNFYSVPFDNFLGWFFIVGFYSTLSHAGFHLFSKRRVKSAYLVPLPALVLSVPLMIGVQMILDAVYRRPHGEVIVFATVLGTSVLVVGSFVLRSSRRLPPSWTILAVPLSLHLLMIGTLAASQKLVEEPSLLVFLPINAVLGLLVWSRSCHDTLFPEKNWSGTDSECSPLRNMVPESLKRIVCRTQIPSHFTYGPIMRQVIVPDPAYFGNLSRTVGTIWLYTWCLGGDISWQWRSRGRMARAAK